MTTPLDDHNDFARDCAEIAATRLARGQISRRDFLLALGALGLIPGALTSSARAADKPQEIVCVNWGGPAIDAYQTAWGQPFKDETGVEVVIDGTGPLASKIRAMVQAGAVTWDVCDTGAGTTLVLGGQGLLEEIDYDIVDPSKLLEPFAYSHGCVNYLFSFALAYNKERVPRAPTGWQDFWDLEAFPGMRTMRKQPNGMLEACMLAAGRTPDAVYPIDLDLAMAKIKEIKDSVIFWGSGSQSQQLFRTGEVVMGNIWHTRANLLRQEMDGAVEWLWKDAVLAPGMWNVPVGNPAGKEWAMRFIASTQVPERQISLFKAMGNGPANPAAAALVPEELRAFDPGQPEHVALQVPFNGDWYNSPSPKSGLTNDEYSRELWLDAITS
ncbi:MAG: ABC transporter substrate-binding protein [Candidatus Competibacterales bacterium]